MSSEPRRFQRSGERPRSTREITADVDPETPVRIGESRYHSAVELPSGEIVTIRCADVDAPGGRLHDAAARGLRPCQSCQPPEYLADPATEDVPVDRSACALEDRADVTDWARRVVQVTTGTVSNEWLRQVTRPTGVWFAVLTEDTGRASDR